MACKPKFMPERHFSQFVYGAQHRFHKKFMKTFLFPFILRGKNRYNRKKGCPEWAARSVQ